MFARELRFAISRKHGGDRLLEAAGLFTAAMAAALATRVKLIVAFDYDHMLKTVLGGGVDVAWLPPLIYARAHAKMGMPVVVCSRAGRLTYRSAILVHENSRFHGPADLKGARVAWTDRLSAAGYVFPRLHLQKHGVDAQQDLKETFEGSMVQAAAAVDRGDADACSTFIDTEDPAEIATYLRRVFGPSARALRLLDQGLTDPIPADGVAVTGSFSPDQKASITSALCGLHESREGALALQSLMQADRLVAPSPELLRTMEDLVRYT